MHMPGRRTAPETAESTSGLETSFSFGVVVGELRVRDGALVAAGDVVVRLDKTVTRANLAVIDKSLIELAPSLVSRIALR